jgi:hypothetical protein
MADEGYTSKRFEEFVSNTRKSVDLTNDLTDAINQANQATENFYKKELQRNAATQKLGEELDLIYKQAEENADFLTTPFEKFTNFTKKFPLNLVFNNPKIEAATKKYKEQVELISRKQVAGQITTKQAFGATQKAGLQAFGKIATSINPVTLGIAGLGGAVIAIGKKIFDIITSVDNATADLIKTTGILDASLSKTLIQATQSSALLGGNVELAGKYAEELVSKLSPAIQLTGKLVGNVAQVGERFQIGTDNAVKLTQIVSELTSTTFESASEGIEGLVDGLGKLGPAVVRNLVDSYDTVIDRFGIGLESLKQQTLQATQLGLSLSKVADISEKLLDFQSSIGSEFKASAILGRQINLQKARQLAFEGNITGALNETLDRVEEIGDFDKLNFFQRKAIAEATGLSVSELQKELNLRRQIGVQGRIDAATRETALGKIEEINRRIQAVLFKVLSSPSVQQAFENFANSIINFLKSPTFNRIANSLGMAVTKISEFINALFEGRVGIDRNKLGIPTGITVKDSMNDGVITPRGDVIKTNPRDYIIATQTPQAMVSNTNDTVMVEVLSLLRHLKQNGVHAEVNLDGKRVSKQIGISTRY